MMATNDWNCTASTKSITSEIGDRKEARTTRAKTMMMMTAMARIARGTEMDATAALDAVMELAGNEMKMKSTSDPGILCFHHCSVKVFCFILPRLCPQCKMELYDEQNHRNDTDNINNNTVTSNAATNEGEIMNEHGKKGHREQRFHASDPNGVAEVSKGRLLPFRLPYPFIRASQYPCAIILRPTVGDFLNDYNNTTDLHIAVTTSTGCVVDFDRYGLRRRRTDHMPEWWQCLLVGDVPEPWYDYWDQILSQVCQQPNKWRTTEYDKDKYNCYTFVLTFLQELAYEKLSEAANSRTTFCEKYIVPRTTTAGKYISLYRKLRDSGIYVHQIITNTSKSFEQQKGGNHCGPKNINRHHQHYNNSKIIITQCCNIRNGNIHNNDDPDDPDDDNDDEDDKKNSIGSRRSINRDCLGQNGNSNAASIKYNGICVNNDNDDAVDAVSVTAGTAIIRDSDESVHAIVSGSDDGGAGRDCGDGGGNLMIIRPRTTLCTIEE